MFVLYALITLFVTLHHEPWRDEADSWLVARDLPLGDILVWSRSAGTPSLWYALLLPLARGGAPYVSQALLHLLIAWAGAAVFLAYAPFGLPTKALFLFSFYPLYEYAVVARTYSLGILLTFCLLALYPRRHAWLLAYAAVVALLYNVNAHSVGMAGAATLLFAVDVVRAPRRTARHIAALALMFAGLALTFAQLHAPGVVVPATVVSAPDFRAFPEAATRAFLPWAAEQSSLWGLAILATVIVATRKNLPALVLLTGSLGVLALIFTYLWLGGFRHYGLVVVASVAAMWVAANGPERSRWMPVAVGVLNVALAVSIPMAIRFAAADVHQSFSGSQEMANYLIQHGLAGREIAAHPPPQAEAVLAHLQRRTFWYAALGRYGSYMHWDRAQRIAEVTPVSRVAAQAAQHFGTRDWLFLSNAALAQPQQYGLTLAYATHEPLMQRVNAPQSVNDEHYWLYRTTDGRR